MNDKCFACDKPLTTDYFVADTRDGQVGVQGHRSQMATSGV